MTTRLHRGDLPDLARYTAAPSRAVAIDTETSDVIMTQPADVARYEWLYDRLRDAALTPKASASLLAKAADMLPDTR